MGDHRLALGELQRAEEIRGGPHRQLRDFGNGLFGDLDRETFGPESGPLAGLAGFEQGEILLLVGPRRHRVADPVAGGAGPVGTVEGKDAGRDFRITHAAADAGECLAVEERPAFLRQDAHQPAGEFERRFDRIGEPAHQRLPRFHDQAIDDDLDLVFLLLVENDLVVEIDDPAVDAGPDIARPPHLQQFLPVFPLPPAHNRRQNLKFLALRQRGDRVDHLLHGLRGDFLSALETVRPPDAGEQQPEIIVDLGNGPDRGTGIVTGALLFDGNGRRQALDRVDIRLAHLFEELPGIGGQRFDVPPLPFGVDGVEGERGLARPAQAGDDDELVARDLDVDVLKIVLPRALDDD